MNDGNGDNAPKIDTPPVWTNDIENYFNHNDIMHMAGRGVILDSYMWVSMNYPKIIGRIESKSMPPGGWSDAKIHRFKDWANAGWPR
ncbi:hypothetical protein ACC719_13770 [Rhizobium ruizarguesonis]